MEADAKMVLPKARLDMGRRMSSFQEAIDPEEEKIRDLEDDFNDGKPFEYDNETFKNLFMQANAMGYPRSVALEAYQVLNDPDLVKLTEYIFLSQDDQRKLYEQRKSKMCELFRLDHTDLIDEIRRLQADLTREHRKTKKLEEQNEETLQSSNVEYYTEYLRALMADSCLTTELLQELEKYQTKNDISKEVHQNTLEKLNVSQEDWRNMRSTTQQAKRGDLCVFPCMHVITAQQKRVGGEGVDVCPTCSEPCSSIEKIFL